MPTGLHAYQGLRRTDAEVELANLNEAPEGPSQGEANDKWHMPPWKEVWQATQQPRVQGKLCAAVVTLVVLIAGILLLTSRPAHSGVAAVSSRASDSSAGAASIYASAAGALPSEPWLQPAGQCTIGTATLGPATAAHSPLGYHVFMSFLEQHFISGDSGGFVAAGFSAAANITLAVHQETGCVSLHASDLLFHSIYATLVAGGDAGQLQQSEAAEDGLCLCGPDTKCLMTQCGSLFKRHPGGESSSWLLSLGTLTAPAGSTLLITTQHTAQFGLQQQQGVWRSSSFQKQATGAAASTASQQQVLINTQFEAIGARTVFPCMDEPKYKAPIVVSVAAPAHLTILSNMPEAQRTSSGSGRVLVEFLPTPPMSTYLTAVAVGDLEAATANTAGRKQVSVWFPRGQPWITPAAAAVPLHLAVAALEHYTSYTGVAQPLTKFDLVAVPGKSGAMENWGLLLFDVERLLYTSPGAWSLFRCASVICHEVAHQWFGNLVTAASWSDLVVNEGLASLAEYGCLARVLHAQLGVAGAAAVMRHVGGPHGRTPGVHEGPLSKALLYDALPTAAPLLGSMIAPSGSVDFGVLVYSKAAAVMAMLVEYAAAGSPTSVAHAAVMRAGPVTQLVDNSPPGATQVLLQQYLRRHMYGSVTALQLFRLFLSLTPAAMSSSALAVITGWRAPGSPLMTVSRKNKQQIMVNCSRRLCSWGTLASSSIDALLASHDVKLPTAGTPSDSSGLELVLSCPLHTAGGDRAMPWTPVYLALHQIISSGQYAANFSESNIESWSESIGNEPNETGQSGRPGNSTSSSLSRQTTGCGEWFVIRQASQQLEMPTVSSSCSAAAGGRPSGAAQQTPLLEGDGGWGLYWSSYPTKQRSLIRQWVAHDFLPQLLQRQQQGGGGDIATAAGGAHDLQLLFTASKLLADQVSVGLSPFGDVSGLDAWAAVQAAYKATAVAATAARNSSTGFHMFGHLLHTLLVPLLPATQVLLERVVGNKTCWKRMQVNLSTVARPVASVATQLFAAENVDKHPAATRNSSSQSYPTSGQFLGAMSLSILLTTTAMTDPAVAGQLCQMFNAAAAAARAADGTVTARLVAELQPDLQDAVLATAASCPEGCQLHMSGADLDELLRQLYLTSPDPAVCMRAAFALAHNGKETSTGAATRPHPPGWQSSLALLLGMGRDLGVSADEVAAASTPTREAGPASKPVPACGIVGASHAAEYSKLVSRAVTVGRVQQAAGTNHTHPTTGPRTGMVGPVADFLMLNWPAAVAALGTNTAWQVMQAVAAQEVVSTQQWQQLAGWALQQYKQQQQQAGRQVDDMREQLGSVLGAAWSAVSWVQHNSVRICSELL